MRELFFPKSTFLFEALGKVAVDILETVAADIAKAAATIFADIAKSVATAASDITKAVAIAAADITKAVATSAADIAKAAALFILHLVQFIINASEESSHTFCGLFL